MSITEIENLSFPELKEKRVELVQMAKTFPSEELAQRYIQARTDAKQRDEKLAEQAKTLAALQTGLEASKQQAERAISEMTEQLETSGSKAAERIGALEHSRVALAAQLEAKGTTNRVLSEDLRTQTERANRLKAEASRNYAALSGAAKLVNDALSQHALENADLGE